MSGQILGVVPIAAHHCTPGQTLDKPSWYALGTPGTVWRCDECERIWVATRNNWVVHDDLPHFAHEAVALHLIDLRVLKGISEARS